MYCEAPPPKPEKPTCRCKNCVLRPDDIVPWTDLMGMSMADRGAANSRRQSTRTRQSWDSVYGDGETQKESSTPVQSTPTRNGGNTPSGISTQQEVSAPPPNPPPAAAAQPTILLIVVNKPEPPSFPGRGYPGSGPDYPGSGPGYPGSGPGYSGSDQGYPGSGPGYRSSAQGYPGSGRGYPDSAPRYPNSRQEYPRSGQEYPRSGQEYPRSGPGYPGQPPRGYGYPGPGPRRSPGPGGSPNGYNYPPPGDRFRNDGFRPYRNDSRYPEDWRRQPRGYPNNNYADPPRNRRSPGNQRDCRCPEKSKSNTGSPGDMPDLNEDRLQASGNRDNDGRLEGSGNPRPCSCKSEESYPKRSNQGRQRNCRCESAENSDFSLNAESSVNFDLEEQIEAALQEVVVTDDKNKTFKCIQVPICISVGKPDCCRCCKCARDPAPPPDSESQSGNVDNDEDEECTCNPQGKCTCVDDDSPLPNEYACECNLTNLERTLRNLIPNADCMCYLKKKKRRRRRKKWAPKVFYDRFANPPFVLNPKPRCLEYGCNPCCNPCRNRCCCAPMAKSCYSRDYCCRGGC